MLTIDDVLAATEKVRPRGKGGASTNSLTKIPYASIYVSGGEGDRCITLHMHLNREDPVSTWNFFENPINRGSWPIQKGINPRRDENEDCRVTVKEYKAVLEVAYFRIMLSDWILTDWTREDPVIEKFVRGKLSLSELETYYISRFGKREFFSTEEGESS